ncbi:hypothetical protein BMW23_0322 [Bodo saltans virus]|uniref:Uncharacterized protein n=1 Tax=Bodo saltans virus TaxID=2024608 RepID=A0A2H4UU66_9VIRU|nr:hypothetical protein QJ851_gp0316 [Bodo saltans virus]ATZ80379.1 hypothetical protein BMW23_0322 [Bodo saltans virus]
MMSPMQLMDKIINKSDKNMITHQCEMFATIQEVFENSCIEKLYKKICETCDDGNKHYIKYIIESMFTLISCDNLRELSPTTLIILEKINHFFCCKESFVHEYLYWIACLQITFLLVSEDNDGRNFYTEDTFIESVCKEYLCMKKKDEYRQKSLELEK